MKRKTNVSCQRRLEIIHGEDEEEEEERIERERCDKIEQEYTEKRAVKEK